MKVLVVGAGGREHAILWKLAQSPQQPKLYCAPGNPGTETWATSVAIGTEDVAALADFAEREGIDLTIIGPEAPLLAGIVDEFEARGLRVFGPRRAAALIEGSKAFAKAVMERRGVPTAKYRDFTDADAARAYVREQGAPIVIKADGLAAGKGVIVAMTLEEAESALDTIMRENAFGDAGHKVVVEEFLTGQEATVMAFVSGETVRLMVPAQDHKPAYDGDKGPNTGGMGTYAPVPVVTPELLEEVERTIIRPVVDGLASEGTPYKGVLYTGLMLTAQGPKVIEFNARFGDPETQVVLPLLESDLLDVFASVVDGTLHLQEISWSEKAAVCVILAAEGYPASYRKGDVISGLESGDENSVIFHAGTKRTESGIVTNGGRVLGISGFGADLRSAQQNAYEAVNRVSFAGAHYRRDIADKALQPQG
ncbi:phosphoribosylamine--glycine ligase [Tumebacillus sp. ITR2]|uniref:Phosphoribosylamine--glycine ligase n=1 Tax=Tumebacillus amylolyticus TaxID=2801339 RepID=A0ABS1JG39_9BACL|nr:phosphoribosylamine--glycine ligase [Tumebacillus amylolyticus]MBL0389241.1 phosphoribosylamine--glycine ligase [Tumebacillus amylolyticus]